MQDTIAITLINVKGNYQILLINQQGDHFLELLTLYFFLTLYF